MIQPAFVFYSPYEKSGEHIPDIEEDLQSREKQAGQRRKPIRHKQMQLF